MGSVAHRDVPDASDHWSWIAEVALFCRLLYDKILRLFAGFFSPVLRKLGNKSGAISGSVTVLQTTQPVRGRVLFSYLKDPLTWRDGDLRFRGHSNYWESQEIARIFNSLGYIVDAIDWNDFRFTPTSKYDIVFDIFTNLHRLEPFLEPSAIKLLHCTGSDPFYQNEAERKRVADLSQRRAGRYDPKRTVVTPDLFRKSMEIADKCSLLGNERTLSTYPPELHKKISLIPVSSAVPDSRRTPVSEMAASKREFLWFFGNGVVHKGLDLVLEVFSGLPQYRLNVVGPVSLEKDFIRIYRKELLHTSNIKYWGFLYLTSPKFKKIIDRVFCFIAPSCSEGLSPSVVSCMQLGLYPIISRDTGVALPPDCGIYLDRCSIEEIAEAVKRAHELPASELQTQLDAVQTMARRDYSRTNFSKKMREFILRATEKSPAAGDETRT